MEIAVFIQGRLHHRDMVVPNLPECMHAVCHENKKSRPFRNNIKGINLSDEGENIQKKIEQAEKAKQLYKCISQLPAAEKSIVLLFLEDLQYKSIADIIGISENHVAVKIGRIKKKLFNCVNE